MKNKLILTDCDGVLLDWQFGFDQWIQRHGYTKKRTDTYNIYEQYELDRVESRKLVKQFNESAAIGWLPPYKDAIYWVKYLHERHGFVFDVITSQSLEPAAQELRKQNLKRHFGDGPFNKFIILDTGADKHKALKKYKDSGCFWIEDKPENAILGLDYGLDSILVEHEHNEHIDHDGLKYAKTWSEIYYQMTMKGIE